MVSLAARYERGEHAAVWDELRHRPVSAADAAAVAEATMRRVARNVDIIVEQLRAAGWRWAYPEMARQAPADADIQAITLLEQRLGPLPAALRACLMQVGQVWLCGTLPGWRPDLARAAPVRTDRRWPLMPPGPQPRVTANRPG